MPATPAEELVATFGRIVVINLRTRADRRRAIDAELRRVGLGLDHPAVHLFDAIRPPSAMGFPSVGAHGAYLSHLGVLEMMLERGWDRMLVVEDDAALAPGFAGRIGGIGAELRREGWDMLYGHTGEQAGTAPGGLIVVPPDCPLIQLHFLGFSARAARAAVPFLRAIMARPPGDPAGGPMHVDGALNWFRAAHPSLRVFAVSPPLAVQRPSRSDITPPRWFDRLPGLRLLADRLRALR